MVSQFEFNVDIIPELERSTTMMESMASIADDVAQEVRDHGPKDGDDDYPDHYVDMIEVESGYDDVHQSVAARVNAMKFTSAWLEWGDAKVKAYAPLRTALDRIGLIHTGGDK